MTDLPQSIEERIELFSEEGNVLLEEKKDWKGAVRVWLQALNLLPEPKNQWEAAFWLYSSLGDAYRQGGDLADAKDMLLNAQNCEEGHMNPFALLRLGETLVDLGETDRGVEYLLRAYMLEGKEIFEEKAEKKYLNLLRDKKLIH